MHDAAQFICEGVDYRLVRSSRRKRLGIILTANGVEVRIPARCAAQQGHQFLRENIHWVQQQLCRAAARQAQIPRYEYCFGQHFPWLGKKLPLLRAENSGSSGIMEGALSVYSHYRDPNQEQLRNGLHQLYRREALALLRQKSVRLVADLGLKLSAVGVRRTKSKWGHCTSGGALQYNWLICLAPEPVVDYLVAHEVSHLRHHNHSREFWQLVQSVCPDYQCLRRWLREQGHCLQV